MPIFYSIIARDNATILAEADSSCGNYPQITLKILHYNKLENGRKTFCNKEYTYNLYNDGHYTYLCLSEAGFPQARCFAYLQDLKNQLMKNVDQATRDVAISYSLNSKLEGIMKERMQYYNQIPEQDGSLKAVTEELKGVELVMQKNLDDISERGDKIQVLVHTAKKMSTEATSLSVRANRLKRKQRWEYVSKRILFGLLGVVAVYGSVTLIIEVAK